MNVVGVSKCVQFYQNSLNSSTKSIATNIDRADIDWNKQTILSDVSSKQS